MVMELTMRHHAPVMRMNRIFCEGPLASGAEVALPAAGAYHVARVLRMREGASLVVFDGSGQDFRAEIVRVAGDDVTVLLGEPTGGAAESPLRITLLQGVSRSERMDWTLQKATELGVAAIAPVLTARSVVRLEGLRLVLSPSAPGSLAGLTSLPTKVELLIGPEGGLDDDELLAAQKAGFMPVRLGPRVLRTETAAVVALTVLQALWGDLQ
jgi:16S rRNA (uracil1498-N3)-methyltransferase